MISMAFLHWLVSRSIFLVQLNIYSRNEHIEPERTIRGCGYSPAAIILALCLGGTLTLSMIGLSLRKLDLSMPLTGPCSIAIAAACNTQEPGAALIPLQYGVMDCEPDEQGRQHVGFSSKEVSPLVNNRVYV